ncbi:MAG: phenylalanine--tRNA ligase subunit beta [candidate division WOR-3 bacterium]|nr:phenylalanine--tRNA ligase subunit beta [candidate division WOR-3 bacterium]MCX7836351.1 phenylalanine--tRNA ligase subunit beta [candidate division WOR-3 bacterium]MDW8113544.1 phenylalanine--tRNA ligase subunit beta [candidate division WOR-3 bacterium]
MKLTLNWLNEFLEPKIDEKELLNLLEKKGIEVINFYNYLKDFSGYFLATIIEKKEDKTILKIDNEEFVINENLPGEIGQKVGYHLKEKKILKGSDLAFPYEGYLVFEEGEDEKEVFNYLDNFALEVEITPNRADLFSVFGIAREIAYFTDRNLILPKVENSYEIERENDIEIIIEDLEKCPFYIATKIINLTIKPSPLFYQWRLFLSGLRPVNNVVDATNYTLLQFGQPLHPFDLKRIFGNKIYVRQGKKGEKIRTIDGVEREVSEKVLCIADSKRIIAIAGIIGGQNTEIVENTTEVLLECALFSQEAIREGINFLNLRTEAARRFELGSDYENLSYSANYAANLIAHWGKGQIIKERKIIKKELKKEIINFPLNYSKRILGITFSKDYLLNIFKKLGGKIIKVDEEEIIYQPPSWRQDLKLPIDLVEEIARYYGYENFPSFFHLKIKKIGEIQPFTLFLNNLRNFLVGRGFYETITLSLLPENIKESVNLLNPLNERLAVLRDTLVYSLLSVISYNHSFNNKNLRIFEIGKVYKEEKYLLAIALTGENYPVNFDVKSKKIDYFDLKGIIEEIFIFLNIPEIDYTLKKYPYFSSFPSIAIIYKDEEIGCLGKINKNLLINYKIEEEVFYSEINLEKVYRHLPKEKIYQPSSPFLPVYRDLSFIIDETLKAKEIIDFIKKNCGSFIKEIIVFDSFVGKPLPPGKRNLGIRLLFHPKEQPYTREELEKSLNKIILLIENNFPAQLRKK